MKFLENVINKILEIPDFYQDIFLFPNKRSAIFFEKYLKERVHIENPFLFPYSKDLRDFVFETTGLNKLDNFNLTFEFFEVYKKIFQNESFETFFMWSQILLKDFEEIDFSNRSSKDILKNVSELQKIEGYVESWGSENPSEFRKKFFYFWNKLGDLYKNFVSHIVKNKKSAYYGYALKYLNQKLHDKKIEIKGRNIYFIGFSNFQKSELEFINLLKDRTHFFFDVDEFFFLQENQNSEIERLFNKFQISTKLDVKKEAFLNQNSLEVFLIPCKNSVEQFKICQSILQNLIIQNPSVDLEEYAIILNDGSQLDTLLNSLPNELNSINITLGFPLEKTYIAKLIQELLELKAFRNTPKYQRILVKIIKETYIQCFFDENEKEEFQKIPLHEPLSSKNLDFIEQINFFKNWLKLETFFDGIDFLQNWIIKIKNSFDKFFSELEKQELYYNLLFLTKLKNHLQKIPKNLQWNTFLIIFKQIIQNELIAFSGEPLKGLQVMELSESQCLDFRYVFMMNVNEGTLPKSADFSSFIPMDIKRYYGLRTPEDFDAHFAYLFFRLFHRSEKMYLFYNQSDKEEESRFIKQTEILLKKFKNIKIKKFHFVFSQNSIQNAIQPIEVIKDENVLKKIQEQLIKGIAPTTFISYIQCPLKFYYTHIEKIKPIDEFEENLMANEFGTIAHESLKEIYLKMNSERMVQNFNSFELNSQIIKNWIENYSPEIHQIVKKNFQNIAQNKSEEGKNYFLLEMIKTIIQKIINKDIERLENKKIKIYGLEKEIKTEWKIDETNITLKGTIDRIELHENGYQIIDYKSGKIGKLKIINLEVFDSENIMEYKEAFQLMFYSMLLYESLASKDKNQKIYAGIYSFRKLQEGLLNLNFDNKNSDSLIDYQTYKKEFKNFIEQKIKELLNFEIPFQQTVHEKNCQYCSFLKNCGKFHLIQN